MMNSAIVTNKLSKSYGSKLALDALSLDVTTGEIFGLLGHNGAGKTTTVNLLTTLLEPTKGFVAVADCPGEGFRAQLDDPVGGDGLRVELCATA
jgi:ABC-type multidrug transport system ATPase subunit